MLACPYIVVKMAIERQGLGRQVGGAFLLCALLLPLLSACTTVVGGGVLAAVVAIGALTSRCNDYLDVTVFDENGRKTCDAIVTATNRGTHFELESCYYAPLTDGHWKLRAELPGGYVDAVSTVEVEHQNDCTRHVQSVELTMKRKTSVLLGAPNASTAPVVLPPPISAPPMPAPAATQPQVPPAAPVQPAPIPLDSGTPPTGVFPESVPPQ